MIICVKRSFGIIKSAQERQQPETGGKADGDVIHVRIETSQVLRDRKNLKISGAGKIPSSQEQENQGDCRL